MHDEIVAWISPHAYVANYIQLWFSYHIKFSNLKLRTPLKICRSSSKCGLKTILEPWPYSRQQHKYSTSMWNNFFSCATWIQRRVLFVAITDKQVNHFTIHSTLTCPFITWMFWCFSRKPSTKCCYSEIIQLSWSQVFKRVRNTAACGIFNNYLTVCSIYCNHEFIINASYVPWCYKFSSVCICISRSCEGQVCRFAWSWSKKIHT